MAKAIAARIETLDEAFLVTLQGFVQAADAEGDAAVAGTLLEADRRCSLYTMAEPCATCCWRQAAGAAPAILHGFVRRQGAVLRRSPNSLRSQGSSGPPEFA